VNRAGPGYVQEVPENPGESDREAEPEATPVAPAPIETAPSATGVVVGDGDELREAPPPDQPEQ
jgi:hypothetical protein